MQDALPKQGHFREGRIVCIKRRDGSLKKTYYGAYGSQSSVQTSAAKLNMTKCVCSKVGTMVPTFKHADA